MDNRGPVAGATGPRPVIVAGMRWQVGVLRDGAENIDWTATGDEPDWARARRRALDEPYALIAAEDCCQEYRLLVDVVPAILFPGINDDGTLDLSGVEDVLAVDRYGQDPTSSPGGRFR